MLGNQQQLLPLALSHLLSAFIIQIRVENICFWNVKIIYLFKIEKNIVQRSLKLFEWLKVRCLVSLRCF